MRKKWIKLPRQLLAQAKKIDLVTWRLYLFGLVTVVLLAILIGWIRQLPPKAPKFKALDNETYQFQAKNKLFSSKLGIREEKPIVSFNLPSGENLVFSYAEATENPSLQNQGDKSLVFSQVEAGVDLRYETLANGLKEEIILNQPRQKTENAHVFTFDSTFQGAYPKEIIEGFSGRAFYSQQGGYLFHFEKPFAIDAAGNRTDDVIIQIEEKSSSKIPSLKKNAQNELAYTIRLTVDEAWLSDPARVYPIIIDPTIIHDESSEFATGNFERSKDTGSGSSPVIESFYQELSADPHTIGLWHFNETSGTQALDKSGNNNHGIASGTTIVDGLINKARSFNGSSDYVEVGDLDIIDNTKTLSTCAWVYHDSDSADQEIIAKNGVGNDGFLFFRDEAAFISARADVYTAYVGDSADGDSARVESVANAGLANSWNHLCMTFEAGKEQGLRLYINGQEDLNSPVSTTTVGAIDASSYPLRIGSHSSGGAFFHGEIDEVVISSRVFTAEEIKAAATRSPYSTYTSPVIDLTGVNAWNSFAWTELGVNTGNGETLKNATSLIAQWNLNETSGTTATNNAGSCGASCNGTLTSFASTASQDQAIGTGWTSNNRRWGAGALMFDGVDDYVTVPDHNSLSFGSGGTDSAFSIETWIYPESVVTGADGHWIISKRNTVVDEYQLVIYQEKLYFSIFTNNANSLSKISIDNILPGKWYHLVATYDGSKTAAGMRVYVNGKEIETTTGTNGTYTGMSNSTEPLTIGKASWSASLGFDGVIDSSRIYARQLSASEIISNYQTGNIELQTRVGSSTNADDGTWDAWAPLTSEGILQSFETNITDDLVAYWKMDETSGKRYDSFAKNDLVANGTGGVSSALGKTGYGADFETTDSDYLEIADNASLSTGNVNFSISAWVYLESEASDMEIITKYNETTEREFRLFYLQSSDVFRFVTYDSAGSAISGVNSTINPTAGNWYHLVVYQNVDNSTIGLVVNDSTPITNSIATTPLDKTSNFLIGARGTTASGKAGFFDGVIDEVAMWKKVLSGSEITQLYQNGNAKRFIDNTDLTNAQDHGGIRTSSDELVKILGNGSNKINTGETQISANTLGFWSLDESSGTGAYIKDTSGNNNHGTLTGTTFTKGKVEGARNFDGIDDQIDFGDITTMDGVSRLTISAWIKPNSLPAPGEYNSIVAKADFTAGGNAFFIRLTSSEGVRFAVRDASNNQLNCDTGKLPELGSWTYITAVLDTSDTCYVYYNGSLQATNTNTSFTDVQNTTTTLKIGASNYASENYFDGIIDEVYIANIDSSAQEVANSYRMARDNYLNIDISENLSTKKNMPFYIAADRPGQYLQATVGETSYANGQADQNTLAFWKMDEDSQIVRDTFSGTSLSSFWTEIDPGNDKIAVNNGLTLTAGTAAAWDSAIVSNSIFTRSEGLTAYMRFTTGAGVAAPNHMMFGIATNSTGVASHTNINHALYFNAGAFYVYQNGSLTGGPYGSNYVANTTYEVRITLTPDGPASYAVKGGVYTNWTTLLSADTSLVNTPVRIQVAQYRHTGTINEIAVYSPTVKIRDASGNNYHGNPGGTISSNGKVGRSMLFPSSTSFINLGSVSIADNLANLTVDAWVLPTAQTAATHARAFSKQHVLYIGQYGDQVSFYMGTGGAWTITEAAGGALKLNTWNHVAWVKSGTNYYIYINGQLAKSGTGAPATLGTNSNTNFIGSFAASTQNWFGNIDELRFSNVARSADDIRQAYEYGMGLRSYPITIDFAAKLDGASLINDSNDLSFIVDATNYGLSQKGSKLFSGDKIIIRENYNGTEYLAQGTVSSVNASTGATAVIAWDSGSTFPPSGFSADADVFKWQREYWPIDNRVFDSHLDAVTNLTLRITDGTEGRTIWLDDLRSSGDYLSDPSGSTITSDIGNKYFQYRAIINSSDEFVSPSLSSATLDYVANSIPNTPTLNSPADTATNQGPTPTLQTTGTDDDSDYLRYKIELCTNLAMTTSCQTFDQTSSQTGWSGQNTQTSTAYTSGTQATYTLQSDLLPNTTYYWRSYAMDPGATGLWSATQGTPYSFTTSAGPSAPSDLQTEGATNPISIVDLTPEFSAIHNDSNSDAAIYYEVEVNTASDFSGTVLWDSGKQSMTSTANGVRSPQISYAGTTLSFNGATHYWRIRFWDSFNFQGDWSAINSFTMNVPPDLPVLDSPANASTGVTFKPTLQTTGTDDDSDYLRYKIELCTNLAMTTSCQTFDQTSSQTGWSGQNTQTSTAYTSGTQATYTLQSDLLPNTTYYWRSYAMDPVGSNTWSATQTTPRSFTTLAAPLPASACYLQKNITNDQILIIWTDNASNEDYYEVQRSVNGGAWTTLQNGLPPNTNNLLDTGVSPDNTYQYRVAPYFTGPMYADWCVASQLNLGIGLFSLEGINASGLHFN